MHRAWPLTLSVFVVALCFCSPLWAEPQATVGLTAGVGVVGEQGAPPNHGEFHLGLRSDVMFLRSDPYDFGLGPYVELATFAFDEFQFGGGASLHIPIHEDLPLVASVGAFGRLGDDDFGLDPGFAGALFWGSRSYNFHANYGLTAGLLVGYRQTFGPSQESTLLIAAQLDLALLALPVIMLIDLARGPSAEAAPLSD
ncbi:MAG TPA: hypothetical protein ENK23_01115 [Sorangium sp.]|nr:hypothetical protein [Sorangium sp.]